MATDPFDFEVDLYDTGVDFESPFVPERNTFSDFFHGLWAGIGETADIFGRGTGSETLQGAGEYIKETSYAKPDVSEYLGVQSQKSKVATGVGQGLPLSAAFMGGGVAGAAAGSVVAPGPGTVAGGVAGTSAVGAAFARGLYDKVVEETSIANPDMPLEEVESYAKKYVAIETLTELADTGVSLAAGKVAGKLTGNAVRAGLKTGLLSLDDVIGASAKRIGAKQLAGAIVGDMALSGGSEVLAENLQYKLDKEYDIDSEAPDYFTTFLIGAAISGPLGGASVIQEKRTQDKIKTNIETGLSSEDYDKRRYMALQVSENLGKVSEEAQKLWDDYAEIKIADGPLSLNDPDLIISTVKNDKLKSDKNIDNLTKAGIINQLDVLKRRELPGTTYTDIVTKPEEILKSNNIPSGTPSPYGEGIAPPGVAKEQVKVSSPTEPQWKKDLPLSKKETNALMDKQVEAYQKSGELPPSKIAEVPTRDKVKAVAEPERKATSLTAQWKKPIYDNPTKIAEAMAELPEDSNTLTVEQQQAIAEKQAKEVSAARVAELSSKPKLTLKEKNELKKLQESIGVIVTEKKAKGTPQVTVQPTAQVSTKEAEAINSEITQLKESIKGPDVSEKEVVSTEKKIEKLQDKLVERDDTVVPKGEITGVDRTGAKTTVSYPSTGWTRVGMTGVLTNGNGILVKRGTRKWEFIQKGTEGERISHGFFTGHKEAIQSLSEGKLPTTKEEKIKEVIKLTESQKALVTTIDPEEVVGKVLAKSYLRDDPEASGVALEAIIKAATTFNPENGTSFKSWAISKAKGAVLDYGKKRAKIYKMERQESSTEVDEGSEKEGKIASATKRDVAAAVPLNVEKEEKVEAPPVKSLKEVLDKHKVPAESRGKYFLDVTDGKKTIESVDKELSSKKPAGEVKNAVEPLEADIAFHGTHAENVNRFSTRYIGSGEGQQVYGYGLYFTSLKDIARWYKKTVTEKKQGRSVYSTRVFFDGEVLAGKTGFYYYKKFNDIPRSGGFKGSDIVDIFLKGYILRDSYDFKSIEKKLDSYSEAFSDISSDHVDLINRVRSRYNKIKKDIKFVPVDQDYNIVKGIQGAVYKVELLPEPDEYLLWGRPYDKQSEKVQKALNIGKYDGKNFLTRWLTSSSNNNGSTLYSQLTRRLGSKKAASNYLHSLGIRGVKYKAAQGKLSGFNYVVFKDEDISTPERIEADTIRRPRSEVDARKAEVTKTATSILDRLGWDKIDAMMFAKDTIPDKAARDKVVAEIDNLTQNTATSILDRYIRGTSVAKEYKNLALFLKRLLSDNNNKLNSLRIRKDPEADSANYDPNTHTVVLTGINTADPTPLHEIAHAITVRELYSNSKVRQEVIDLMDLVGQEAVARGLVSQENLDKVKALQKRTGQEFKKVFTNDREIETTERAILYALTNEFEFMAQPFNNKGFSQFLTTVELPSTFKKTPSGLKSAVKSIYDAIVGILAKMFSRTGVSVSNSAMKRMLELYTELAGQDTTVWTEGSKTYGVDVLESPEVAKSFLNKTIELLKDNHKFTNWFKDSKVRDSNGNPLVLFHGTQNEIINNIFEIPYGSEAEKAIAFTDDPSFANRYAVAAEWNEAQVIPTVLNFKNPKIIDYRGMEFRPATAFNAIRDAKAEGHDSVIINNVLDTGHYGGVRKLTNQYFAFDPKQIKSVFAKEFNPTSESYMEADTFQSDKVTTSAEQQFKTMKELEVSLKDSPTAWLKKQVVDIKDTIKDYAQSTTTRLAQISQTVSNHLRNMEFNISIKNQEYSKEVKPFIDKYDKLPQKDRLLLDLYLMNADGTNEYSARRDQILKDNKMLDEYVKVKKVLADIYKRRKVVGLNKTNEVEDYWPRVVKDINALRQSMKDDGSYGVIEAQIDREGLNATDREAAITSLVNTGRMPKLAFKTPSSAKERQIHVVPATWKHHYMNTSEALVHHIYENNEAIESRAMFGSTKRKQNAELRDRLYKTLESKRPESKGYNRTTKKIVEIEVWLEDVSDKEYQEGISEFLEKSLTNVEHNRKLKELENIEEDLKTLKVGTAAYALAIRNRNKIQKWISSNPISTDVGGVDLSPKDQSDLIKLLRGRLTQTGMTGTWAALRNLSLMSVLGNPLSAVTQLGDISFSLSDAGVKSSLQSAFGKKVVSARDLDLAHSLREFQTGKTAAWLDWSLRRFGMTAMDKFGKELYMNAVINKAKKSSLDQFRSEWGKYLEKDTEQIYKDIKDGKDTNLVKFFAFNALSEVQPISLSEMPMKYLTAGNGRFFYALKSYNIKLLNNLYKRIVYNTQEAKTPKEKMKAMGDASKLLVLVILAGATADELKDFILGKVDSQSYSDRVTDNLLKMVMVSKFSLQKAERDGFFKSFVSGNLIPPLQLADDPIKDLRNLIDPEKESSFYTLRNIPGAGKLAYSWITDTAEKSEYGMIKSKILEDYKDGSSYGQLRRKINKYNAWARNVDEPLITFSTLRRTKKAQ